VDERGWGKKRISSRDRRFSQWLAGSQYAEAGCVGGNVVFIDADVEAGLLKLLFDVDLSFGDQRL
jgi:hypothetical protein